MAPGLQPGRHAVWARGSPWSRSKLISARSRHRSGRRRRERAPMCRTHRTLPTWSTPPTGMRRPRPHDARSLRRQHAAGAWSRHQRTKAIQPAIPHGPARTKQTPQMRFHRQSTPIHDVPQRGHRVDRVARMRSVHRLRTNAPIPAVLATVAPNRKIVAATSTPTPTPPTWALHRRPPSSRQR